MKEKRWFIVCDNILANSFLDEDDEPKPYAFGPLTEDAARERCEYLNRDSSRCAGPHHVEEGN